MEAALDVAERSQIYLDLFCATKTRNHDTSLKRLIRFYTSRHFWDSTRSARERTSIRF
jgi:hypothetical protein